MIFVIDNSHFKMQQFDAGGGRQALPVKKGSRDSRLSTFGSSLRYFSVWVLLMIKAFQISLHTQELLGALMKYNLVSLHLRASYTYLSGLYFNLDNVALEGMGPLLLQVGQGEARGYGAALEDAKPVW
uniref:Uncharacterized protein n=1 Tax=Myotis myotis TaxID=51298 RepID=A0A7J7V3P3_MYOMY|nr:hypothetical protein mMyoMyo1_008522 [Myotis myotis]